MEALDLGTLEPELAAVLRYAPTGGAHDGVALVTAYVPLQALAESPTSGAAWRARPSAFGTSLARRGVLRTVEGWLAVPAPANVILVGTLLVFYAAREGPEGVADVLRHAQSLLHARLLPQAMGGLGFYDPPDAIHAASRLCIVTALLAAHPDAPAYLCGPPGVTMATFACRVAALYPDRPPTEQPPAQLSAAQALGALRALGERASPVWMPGSFRGTVARAAAAALARDCFSGGGAAAVGEHLRNAVATPADAAGAMAAGAMDAVLEALQLWPRHAGAQEQLLFAAYNLTCCDAVRMALARQGRVVVRVGRAALDAARAHPAHRGVAVAALQVLRSPVSTTLGAEAAGVRWCVDEGGMDVLAALLARAVERRDWEVAMAAARILGLWVANPAGAEALGEPLYDALCAACRACRAHAHAAPDGLRMALAAALAGFARHPAHGLRASQALALMDEPDDDAAAAAPATAAPAA